MQRFLAKYGLAAHLALLAVAPLFLLPFFNETIVARTELWFAGIAVLWVLFSPSVYAGERPHQATKRVAHKMFHDPLFWVLLLISIMALLRSLNGGVRMAYDAEIQLWSIAAPVFELFPGVAEGCGDMALAAAVGSLVIVQGCRHALGGSARMAFLLMASTVSGVSGLLMLYHHIGVDAGHFSFVGVSFALHLMGGIVALAAAFEHKWASAVVLFPMAIGGNAAALFAYMPLYGVVVMLAVALLIFIYSFVYVQVTLRASNEFRYLVIFAASLTVGGLVVYVLVPEADILSKWDALLVGSFWPESFFKLRAALSTVALKAWFAHLWIGSGLGSFAFDMRFYALAKDWPLIAPGIMTVPNGWFFLLAERGVVGAATYAVPAVMLFVTYVRRLVQGVRMRCWPHPAVMVGPLALFALVFVTFFDCSLMRADVLMMTGALLAISANAFPKRR